WDAIIKEYGRLSLADVLEPAIEYASSGFPFSKDQYVNTMKNVNVLREYRETSSIFLPNNRVPKINEKFIQKNLANTLK
ncbi:gamma-glutamyltransferase family protein, partial [Escherichia coli]|nr:gamma-glutamyltransferase family protein [Escherichia coli]